MAIILGLNAYHGDSAACLVRDGELVAAAEEERFRRIKHWAGFPREAVAFCLREAGVRLAEVHHVAINRNPRVNNLRRLLFVLTRRPDPRLVLNRIRNIRQAATMETALRAAFPGEALRAQVHHVEHHLAHLASAFLVSDFEEAVCVSVDGFGDFASAAWGLGRRGAIQIDGRVYFPHSLGIFYSAITQWLGFPHYGDEYKVMGLAPYGEPRFLDAMRQIVRVQPDGSFRLNLKFFRHHVENVTYTWNDCAPEVGPLYTGALEELLGPARRPGEPLDQRHRDVARSAQAMYEEAFFALLNAVHSRYRCPNLALAGGCAMNSVANGKVYLKTPFRKLYLPAAAGDAGGAIGAAFVVHHRLVARDGERARGGEGRPEATGNTFRRFHMRHAYVGPGFDEAEIRALVASRAGVLREQGCAVEWLADEAALCERTARAIADGLVVGWFQGRMEWGPRALGNRSILCDPRRADMKDVLNARIKRRESFRPFAPSILRERVAEWFEQDDDVPFMMQVFQVRSDKRALVPATTHVDGSGRLHTVSREANPLYHRLIEQFEALTGVPMVLNTSFNENEPVVCRPEEALDCFLRTRMDVLVLGRVFITRPRPTG
ncbi:MAG: carbamoyltransferase C-terminal domain-containing protein [Verrucomicrobiales bacterium]|nr:carbamoyltransferase C-terminal domain-containing protein [Verrucomicrobiales bacterium]